MKNEWKKYEPFVKAVVELFHPFVEGAIHDLKKGKIAAIYNNFSRRKVGDPSPLHELGVNTKDFPDYFKPYDKKNWDGAILKCTSITLRNEKGEPIGLICLNVDTSFARNTHQLLESFLKIKEASENPIETFGGSCETQARALIEHYLTENHLSLAHLNRRQKQELVLFLYNKGIFNFKNAAPFVAAYLKLSRASIYNYLK